MWTTVFIAQDENTSSKICKIFDEAEILVKIKPFINEQTNKKCFEIFVPFSELNEALDLIIDVQI